MIAKLGTFKYELMFVLQISLAVNEMYKWNGYLSVNIGIIVF